MRNRILRLSAIASLAAWLGACQALTQSDSTSKDVALNGEAATMGRELDNMSATQGAGMAAALLKPAAADTDSALFTVTPPHYDSACACFIRVETWSGDGYDRTRVDSITYLDDAGAHLHARNFAKLKSVHHIRTVTRTTGAHTFSIRFETIADITVGTDTVGVWNGTVSGSYDGEALKSGSVTGVTRTFHNRHWGFASAGSMVFTRPLFSWEIDFLGDGKAKATRTNNLTKHVLVIDIDRNYQETAR